MEQQDWSANPFQDPSVQGASGTTRNVTTINTGVTATDEFNPFAPAPAPTSWPQQKSPPSTAPTPSTVPQSSKMTEPSFSALADREMELNRKEEQLKQRQADIERREADLSRRNAKGGYVPNWPPFPEWMPPPFKPWVYHSIQNDIPQEMQGTMYNLFGLWYCHCFCYVVNIIAAMAGMACDGCDDTSTNLVLAIVFLCVFVPGSFKMWYRVLYNGLKKDRGVNFMIFFFVFGFQILANIYFSLGFEGTGACGWVAAGYALKYHFAIGIFYFISALSWTVCALASVYMIMRVHSWYRGTDYTIERAEAEVVHDVGQNATVQGAVMRAVF